jgi:hypothetical protein
MIFTRGVSYHLKYAEYVGSGGNCDDVAWGGSASADKWSCTDVTTKDLKVFYSSPSVMAAELDISSSSERGIAYADNGTEPNRYDVAYASCTSNCTSEGNWNSGLSPDDKIDTIFYDDGNSPTGHKYGLLSSIEFGSGPRVAFADHGAYGYQDVFYAEQEGDVSPAAIPQFSSYRVALVVGVVAFGLFLMIVLIKRRDKGGEQK